MFYDFEDKAICEFIANKAFKLRKMGEIYRYHRPRWINANQSFFT